MNIYHSKRPENVEFQNRARLVNNIPYAMYEDAKKGRIYSLAKASLYSVATVSIVPLLSKNFRVHLSDYWRGFINGEITISRYAKISKDLSKKEKNMYVDIAKRSNPNSTLSGKEIEDLSNRMLVNFYNNNMNPTHVLTFKDPEIILRYMVLRGDIYGFNLHGNSVEVAINPPDINKFQAPDSFVTKKRIDGESKYI